MLVHHNGYWPIGKAAESKYLVTAIQNSRFTLVNNVELYDLKADPGETRNIITEHPEVVSKFRTAYDQWWQDVQPYFENENAVGPKINPMKALYWQQFGGGPDEALLKRMDPSTAVQMSESIAESARRARARD